MVTDRESIEKKIKRLKNGEKVAILIDCAGSLSNVKVVFSNTNEEEAKELLILKEHKNLTVSIRFLVSIEEYDRIMSEFEETN